jgi:hypothetical protein
MMLTQAYLKSVLNYDPETGIFTWAERPVTHQRMKIWNKRFAGKIAGGKNKKGYIEIGLLGRLFKAHRLAWLYMTGEWPKGQGDHENRNRSDNRWGNLRDATHGQNRANSRPNSGRSLKGAYESKKGWDAAITTGGKRKHLGTFDCPAAAHFAYVVAADKCHGKFARAA